jgi:hypothetical protein
MRRFLPPSACLVAVLACNSTDQGTVQLVTGEETDVFTQAPAPTQLLVYAVDSSSNDGGMTELASGPVSSTSIDLGNQDENGTAVLQVWGEDDAGAVVVFGQSLSLQYGAIAGGTLPLFVQRTNELARLPSPPTDARTSPVLAIIQGEFLFIGGGSGRDVDAGLDSGVAGGTTQLYDFASYAPLSSPPTLAYAFQSMPIVGTVALLIDSSSPNGAYYYDFSQDEYTAAVSPPSNSNNFTFADVAGGQTFYDVDPTSGNLNGIYVIGATRLTGSPTAAVLYINPNDTSNSSYQTGNLTFYSLTVPRLGAAAAAIDARGLVVAGGSTMPPGLEVVGPNAVQASFSFPADPTVGAGATPLPSQNGESPVSILLAGGVTPAGKDAGVRQLALNCNMSCVTPWGTGLTAPANLPVPITAAYAFSNAAGTAAYVVGNEPATATMPGLTQTFLLSSTMGVVTPVPTKATHTYASAIESPVGSVLIFGGPSDDIESFTFPPPPN